MDISLPYVLAGIGTQVKSVTVCGSFADLRGVLFIMKKACLSFRTWPAQWDSGIIILTEKWTVKIGFSLPICINF